MLILGLGYCFVVVCVYCGLSESSLNAFQSLLASPARTTCPLVCTSPAACVRKLSDFVTTFSLSLRYQETIAIVPKAPINVNMPIDHDKNPNPIN